MFTTDSLHVQNQITMKNIKEWIYMCSILKFGSEGNLINKYR